MTRYWVPERRFVGLSLTPDGRGFWTSTQFGELLRFDIASEKVLLPPILAGAGDVHGVCGNLEYTAAEDTCRAAGPAGEPVVIPCPILETCGNLLDDDGDGVPDDTDADCRLAGALHPLLPVPPQSGIRAR